LPPKQTPEENMTNAENLVRLTSCRSTTPCLFFESELHHFLQLKYTVVRQKTMG